MLSKSLEDTEKIAKNFVNEFLSKKANEGKALVVGLYGDLGSGKTTFTKAVAKILKIKEDITSPTYVLIKNYQLENNSRKQLIHIDAYRLDLSKELLSIGWGDIVGNSENIIFIEWPERVADILPENHIKINFEFLSENERQIKYLEK